MSEYETPYQTTIIYDPNYILQSSIAHLSYRAQLIESGIIKTTNGAIDINVISYLSPDVLLFAHNNTSDIQNITQLLLDKGYQHVFIYDDNKTPISIDNPLIAVFNHENIHDYITPADLQASYILEYIICAKTSAHHRNRVSKTECCQFVAGVMASCDFMFNFPKALEQLLESGYKCYDNVSNYITVGKSIFARAQKQALMSSFKYDLCGYNIIALHCDSQTVNIVSSFINTGDIININTNNINANDNKHDFLITFTGGNIVGNFMWCVTITQLGSIHINELTKKLSSEYKYHNYDDKSLITMLSVNESQQLFPFMK